MRVKFTAICLLAIIMSFSLKAQVSINEGSNRNFSVLPDEDNEFDDWIELYNNSSSAVNLYHYSLTDDPTDTLKWVFPNVSIDPGAFRIIYCSSKNRKPVSAFQQAANITSFTPVTGWNIHTLTHPFYWDGVSNIIINTCSYSSTGYTVNSVFNQTETSFYSSVFTYVDNSADACGYTSGGISKKRPNMKINGHPIGTGTVNNGPYDYPAPYGNWYWSSRHQMLIRADELAAAGVVAGPISSLGFDVVSTDPSTQYSYIEIQINSTYQTQISSTFEPLNPSMNLHTNFSLNSSGETVYLYNPSKELADKLQVNCINVNDSKGRSTDGGNDAVFFSNPTPDNSNNQSSHYDQYLQPPVFSKNSGLYTAGFSVTISNPNLINSEIRYTTDGSDPSPSSALYTGIGIYIGNSTVLKARTYSNGYLPSPLKASSYLIGINHTTPVLSVITDNKNLYGPTGIFDNWSYDWDREAYAEYFEKDKSLVFSQPSGIQIDGGAGGSRSQPQHSFRLELDHSVLGGGPVSYPLIPDKPERNKYSKIYLRNGSNQYLIYPYKDACCVKGVCKDTKTYYSAYTPVSVYLNGSYFGLYEMREKFDPEYFKETEGADEDSVDILSVSYWYGGMLRAVCGSVDSFYAAFDHFSALDAAAADYWDQADRYFDLESYTDYIAAETFMQNTDWPWNNIKFYRSNKSGFRYRFAVIDVEWGLQPHGWSQATDNPFSYLFNNTADYPYTKIWLKSIQNPRFKNYFINRYADLLNTTYLPHRLISVEDSMYNQVLPEMPGEYTRWGYPNNTISAQMNDLRSNHLTMQSQFNIRGQQVRNFIQSDLGMTSQVHVTLKTIPADAGMIKISTITPGPLPWTGVYFNGNEVGMTAIANPGYEFAYWDTNNLRRRTDTASSISMNISDDATFTAVFRKIASPFTAYPATDANYLVYPNPAVNEVNIFLNNLKDGTYPVTIFSILGQKMITDNISVSGGKGIKTINLRNFSSGMYVASIRNGLKSENIKLIVTHEP